ncbi:MAG: sensor histidine kinase [Alphaproteobacteria bacterium]|nr:sensor histidine kinase [Alphaproteobacteria bacterium]MBU1517169.1 sensor histidine kinase [Alphaproteobacteria bacterium]MBU2096498.1 sensor histidine kinase [Alphaproteobacteria bacterium]MBU2151650.1 sensor histidine kinase [Alphaproteobacteria bacterium]MBU2305472.1 sensor histidine kinase [Alphaproteobacteria bacterium]
MRALNSIRGRLLLSGMLFTAVAVVIASLTVTSALDRFARRSVDASLEAQIALLSKAVGADGTLTRDRIESVGPFARPGSGWAWTITGPTGKLQSPTVTPLDPKAALPPERRDRPKGDPRGSDAGGPRDDDRRGRDGHRRRFRSGETETFYFRSAGIDTTTGPVTVTAGAPRYVRDRMREQALKPLLLSLAVLGVGLLLAMIAQLELGLRPLRRLAQSLARVRAGEQSRVTDPQPSELTAVVTELNVLLDHNEEALAKARAHVSNLAHGLKTPLATLSLRLAEPGRDPGGSLATLIAQIDGAIGHHLGRARAASPGAPGQPSIPLRPRLDDLVVALSRIHAAKAIGFTLDVPADLQVNCDPQDLDEMAGNLLDNACKWAAGAVQITARKDGRLVVLTIDDDGPGLSEAAAVAALVPGQRLDEQQQGHGFGLSIARELAELHDGSLVLTRSPQGGLRVILSLPASVQP